MTATVTMLIKTCILLLLVGAVSAERKSYEGYIQSLLTATHAIVLMC